VYCKHQWGTDSRCVKCGTHRTEYEMQKGKVEFTSNLPVGCVGQFGSDEHIARVARHDRDGSTGGLIKSMMKHRHGSPFEFGHITFKCELPHFVIQQMLRHRIGVSFSQWSLRWEEAIAKAYLPPPERKLYPLDKDQKNVRANKYQEHTRAAYRDTMVVLSDVFNVTYSAYQQLLADGVSLEVARTVLPAAQVSIIHVSFNPRSLMHFLSLRIDSPDNRYESHPQWEVEQVARSFEEHFAHYWPLTYNAFYSNGRVAP
jgi:thymidylate synthase (FAD)